MDIIGRKYIFLGISAVLVLASVLAVLLWGLKFGIDFTGGSLLEARFEKERPALEEIRRAIEPANLGSVGIQPAGDKDVILRFREANEAEHQSLLNALGTVADGKIIEQRFDAIGPTVGKELRKNSVLAVIVAIFGIVIYISWAFRAVSKPVSSWKYGIAAIFALAHDVIIPLGIFSILGRFKGIEIDALFVSAVLTILGFSVHDTIVVFDRIRENLRKLKSQEPFALTVNRSMNETFARSINTSFTVLLVLLAVFFFGGTTVSYFALALIIGIVFGTYSSIFVASPLLAVWEEFGRKKGVIG